MSSPSFYSVKTRAYHVLRRAERVRCTTQQRPRRRGLFSHHCDLDAISVSVCDEIQVDPRQGLIIISASASDAEMIAKY